MSGCFPEEKAETINMTDLIKRIEKLESMSKDYFNIIMINSALQVRLEKLEQQEHKTKYIVDKDATIAIDIIKRVVKLEQLVAERGKNLGNVLGLQNDWSLKVDERIEKLENFMPDVLQDFDKRLVKFEQMHSNVAAIVHQIERDETLINRIMKLEQTVENLAQKKDVVDVAQKHPHKCPLCYGKTPQEIKIEKNPLTGNDKLLIDCHACLGAGIVWG